MRKTMLSLIFAIGVLFIVPFVMGVSNAAFLKLDKTSYTVTSNGTFNADVIVDAGSDTIRSADVVLSFDPTLLQATSFSAGTYFPTVANDLGNGKVTLTAYFNDSATSKSGSGTIGTIAFKALKDGTGSLSFNCGSATDSKVSKDAADFPNIIVCTQNVGGSVTVGSGGVAATATPGAGTSGTNSTTLTPTGLPVSGAFDNTLNIAIPGMILLFIGVGLKFLL